MGKQLRCIICNKLITPIKGIDRKCCIGCKQLYTSIKISKCFIGATKEEIFAETKRRVKERKEKNEKGQYCYGRGSVSMPMYLKRRVILYKEQL